jgi:hypothetical protein
MLRAGMSVSPRRHTCYGELPPLLQERTVTKATNCRGIGSTARVANPRRAMGRSVANKADFGEAAPCSVSSDAPEAAVDCRSPSSPHFLWPMGPPPKRRPRRWSDRAEEGPHVSDYCHHHGDPTCHTPTLSLTPLPFSLNPMHVNHRHEELVHSTTPCTSLCTQCTTHR